MQHGGSLHYRATIYSNQDFICVRTDSSTRLTARDPEGEQHFSFVDCDNEQLGECLLSAPSKNRTLSISEQERCFDPTRMLEDYRKMDRGTHVRTGLQKHTHLVQGHEVVLCHHSIIKISRSRRDRLETWSGDGISIEDHVLLPADRTPVQIGRGIRWALSALPPGIANDFCWVAENPPSLGPR